MTNFEKIKNMSIEELANALCELVVDCECCPIRDYCNTYINDANPNFEICLDPWKQWLKSEVEE